MCLVSSFGLVTWPSKSHYCLSFGVTRLINLAINNMRLSSCMDTYIFSFLRLHLKTENTWVSSWKNRALYIGQSLWWVRPHTHKENNSIYYQSRSFSSGAHNTSVALGFLFFFSSCRIGQKTCSTWNEKIFSVCIKFNLTLTHSLSQPLQDF